METVARQRKLRRCNWNFRSFRRRRRRRRGFRFAAPATWILARIVSRRFCPAASGPDVEILRTRACKVRGRNRFHTAAHINIPTLQPESERAQEGFASERASWGWAREFLPPPQWSCCEQGAWLMNFSLRPRRWLIKFACAPEKLIVTSHILTWKVMNLELETLNIWENWVTVRSKLD